MFYIWILSLFIIYVNATFVYYRKRGDDEVVTAPAVSTTNDGTDAPPTAPAGTNSNDAVPNNTASAPSQSASQDSEAYDGSGEQSPHTFQVVVYHCFLF